MPKNSSLGAVSVDVEQQYQKGRVPENAFVKDETIELVVTCILDRR